MADATEKYAFFLIGNTFEHVKPKDAPWDKTKKYRKIYKWTIYLDVVEGNRQVVAQVKAIMGMGEGREWVKVENRPKEVTIDGKLRWRFFESTQSTYGPIRIQFDITGIGGTTLRNTQYVIRPSNYEETDVHHFFEPKPAIPNSITPTELPSELSFRLEFVAPIPSISSTLANLDSRSLTGENLIDFYKKMVQNDHKELSSIELWPRVQVDLPFVAVCNDSFLLQSLVKICQNAIKYEFAIDQFFNRRELKSNKEAVKGTTNKYKHDSLASCQSVQDLMETMLPEYSEGRSKFNILNSGATVEFCFGSVDPGSDVCSVVEFLTRFSVHFVNNTIRFRPPNNLKDSRTVAEARELLFQHVIKDKHTEQCLNRCFDMDESGTFASSGIISMASDHFFPSSICMNSNETVDMEEALDYTAQASTWEGNLAQIAADMFVNSGIDSGPRCRKRPRTTKSNQVRATPKREMEPIQSKCLFQVKKQLSVVSRKSSIKSPPFQLSREMIQQKEKCLTFRLLQVILKKVNVSLRNQRHFLLEKSLKYFNARQQELSHYFSTSETNEKLLVGIQLVQTNDEKERYDTIDMYLPGGRKLFRVSASANLPKCEEMQCEEAEFSDLCEVLDFLGRSKGDDLNACIAELDGFLNDIFTDDQLSESCVENEIPPTRFVIIHDKPMKKQTSNRE